MTSRLPRLLAGLVVVLVAGAGCGERTADGVPADAEPAPKNSDPAPTTTKPTTPLLPTRPSKPTAPTKPTVPPSEGQQKIRVVGEITSVGDCVVVRDDNAITWTISGKGAGSLAEGDRVQVTGAPDLRATGCGGPLVIATTVTVTE